MIDGTRAAQPLLADIAQAAEQAASRLLNDGNIYIASSRPDFVSEGFIRSGGLMMLREYDPQNPPAPHDVVIVGWSDIKADSDPDLLSQLDKSESLVIGIGPTGSPFASVANIILPSDLAYPETVVASLSHNPYPIVSLQNLILLWTFTGELVAALSRKKHMPVMFQSVLVPGARDRNASFRSRRFHAVHDVPPIPAGQLGSSYLDKISGSLAKLLGEVTALVHTAEACVEVLSNEKRIHAFLISHFPVHQAGAPGDPGYMTPLETFTGETPDLAELESKLEPGDLFFFLGYYRRPAQAYEIARDRGCKIVGIITGADEPAASGPAPDHFIHPGWHYTDSLVDVPGYDVRILPASGILQSAVYWSVVGGITERLASS